MTTTTNTTTTFDYYALKGAAHGINAYLTQYKRTGDTTLIGMIQTELNLLSRFTATAATTQDGTIWKD